jgi:hypothetical protein
LPENIKGAVFGKFRHERKNNIKMTLLKVQFEGM